MIYFHTSVVYFYVRLIVIGLVLLDFQYSEFSAWASDTFFYCFIYLSSFIANKAKLRNDVIKVLKPLTFKALFTTAARDIFFFYFLEKVRLGISYESSARHTLYMNCQGLFSLKLEQVPRGSRIRLPTRPAPFLIIKYFKVNDNNIRQDIVYNVSLWVTLIYHPKYNFPGVISLQDMKQIC